MQKVNRLRSILCGFTELKVEERCCVVIYYYPFWNLLVLGLQPHEHFHHIETNAENLLIKLGKVGGVFVSVTPHLIIDEFRSHIYWL